MSIDPAQRTDIVVKEVFLELLDSMKCHEATLREEHSEKVLHGFRIAVRKTRSLLSQCKNVLPANRLSRFKREFSWLGNFTSGPRDLDVYLVSVKKLKRNTSIAPAEIDIFIEYLLKRRDQQHQRLYDSLQSSRYKRLKQDWETFLNSPVPQSSALGLARIPVKKFSNQGIWSCYARVIKQGKHIKSHSGDASVHELRKSCKKLRYMIEFFRELYPQRKISTEIKQLKAVQNQLGEFQDLCVQEKIMQDFIQALDRDIWAPVSTRQLMDKLLGKSIKKKRALHKKIPRVFSKYSSKEYQSQCKKLFSR